MIRMYGFDGENKPLLVLGLSGSELAALEDGGTLSLEYGAADGELGGSVVVRCANSAEQLVEDLGVGVSEEVAS